MKPKDKNKFIAKTAAKVLAASHSGLNESTDPLKPKAAIAIALDLWAELEKQNLISAGD